MNAWIAAVMTRELKALKREVEAYPSDADLWRTAPGTANPGGNLALHLAGNIQYFVGAVLGGSGYVRDRDEEFKRRDLPRAEVVREIERALARVGDADLAKPYPQAIGGVTPTTGAFLTHLAVHLSYHLGQVDYHRRILTREGKTVGAMAVGELRP